MVRVVMHAPVDLGAIEFPDLLAEDFEPFLMGETFQSVSFGTATHGFTVYGDFRSGWDHDAVDRIAIEVGAGDGMPEMVLSDLFGVTESNVSDLITGTTPHILARLFAGNDRFVLSSGDDRASGLRGHDVMLGRGGHDLLRGGAGSDLLEGGRGADTLVGGAGDDLLVGGQGADRFVMTQGSGADRILNFTPGQDVIEVIGAETMDDLILSGGHGEMLIRFGLAELRVTGLGDQELTAADFLF